MLRIEKTPVTVPKHLGGSEPLFVDPEIPDEVFVWLKDAAEGAVLLIKNDHFPATFQRYSQVDTMTNCPVMRSK